MKPRGKLFIALAGMIGAGVLLCSFRAWVPTDLVRFCVYLGFALLASELKVAVPGVTTSLSVSFLFSLLGVIELSLPETMILGCLPLFVQCFRKTNPPAKAVGIWFNVLGMMAPATWAAWWVYRLSGPWLGHSASLMILAAVLAFYLANTLPIALLIALTEGRSFRRTWYYGYCWSVPYYLAGAALVLLLHLANRFLGWQTSLLVLPALYGLYHSYRLYLRRLEDEKRHVEDMASLHLRTIEALALAIDAKDHTTHNHLQRVQVYATELGENWACRKRNSKP